MAAVGLGTVGRAPMFVVVWVAALAYWRFGRGGARWTADTPK
jgi:hypothetical protein